MKPRLSWQRLLLGAAAVDVVLLLGSGVVLGDAEAIALAVFVLLTTACLAWRPGRILIIVRALAFADVLFFMAPAAISNIAARGGAGAVGLPLALAVSSGVGLTATVAWLRLGMRRAAPSRSAFAAAALGLAVFAIAAGVATTRGSDGDHAGAGALTLTAKSAKFSTASLQARSGAMTIELTNDDLFWHTVTIDELKVDLRVPVRAHRSVTFTAKPGVYNYYCAIPGHAALGMRGTLTAT